jgi:flavin reductase (DIM6/NTAB) family NADH-FMN oxidoreductase RutF
MAMSSFTSVSLDPTLVSVCADRGSTTWPQLAAAPWLGVSILGAGHVDVCQALSRKTGDRFAGVTWHSTPRGAVLIDGSPLWIECRVYDVLEAGDHWIALLEAGTLVPHSDTAPLIFHNSRLRPLPT